MLDPNLDAILLSTIATAAYFIFIAQLMRKLPKLSSNFFLCVSNFSAALILTPLWLWLYYNGRIEHFSPAITIDILTAAFFLLISRELYFYAYARTDIANITVFSAFTPIYTLASGFFILHEVPSLRVVAGVSLIAASVYFLFMPQVGQKRHISLLQPFHYILGSLPIFCGFLSTIPTAFGALYQKKALSSVDAVTFSLCLFILIGTAALIIELVKEKNSTLRLNSRILIRWDFWISAILLALMHVSFAPVLVNHPSASALALQRCSILFQIIFAYFFLDQKDFFFKRMLVGMFIILGFILLCEPH